MEYIDLLFNAIKILRVYYSYDKNFENQENFINLVLKIETLLSLWRMKNLSIAGKITVFKTLVISKIVYLALVKVIPNSIILKQTTLYKDYENGGLINVDIMFKIISLQCSWITRLFLFHSNLYIDPTKIRQFLRYYQEILSKWNSNLSVPPKTSSAIASQIIWYNKDILVD